VEGSSAGEQKPVGVAAAIRLWIVGRPTVEPAPINDVMARSRWRAAVEAMHVGAEVRSPHQ
jgi:hypothetical protein